MLIKNTTKIKYTFLLWLFLGTNTYAQQQLIHYWNFNDNSSEINLLNPSHSIIAGASISHIAGGISAIDVSGGTGQNFDVDNHNARNGAASGTHLRFNDPIGGELVFALPTSGYEEVVVKFATRRSGSGAGLQYWSYTTDGTIYIPFDTIAPNNGNPVLETLDFSGVAAADDNPEFKLKVSFAQGGGGTVGNNRFDNFTLDAFPVGGVDNVPPLALFSPIDQTPNVAVTINPKISFNEPVRRVDNSPIDNTNAASLVELRLNDQSGALVPFTTTFSNNEITIMPNADLANSQQYYVAVLENAVEDLSDNAIASVQSVQFTTISLQTAFSAGDLVFVAYRMNATGAEDEIALLTLVDIIPGTFINLTDAKFTSNAQPQCTGGIVWTSPDNECITAGTVITIQTDAMVANKGTVTGSGFGLSSGGDQVIVYTSTAASPHYITALSSNGWIAENTSCSGSLSMIPAGLADGLTAVNLSTAPGNVSGNSVNAYYNGSQSGNPAQLKAAILDPANWIAIPGSTDPQIWPAYNFPGPPNVSDAGVISSNSIQLIFNTGLDPVSAANTANYTGISGLMTVEVTSNGSANDTVTLIYGSPFVSGSAYTLTVNYIFNADGIEMVCPFTFAFNFDTRVSFASNLVVVDEDAGTLNFTLNIEYPSNASVDLIVWDAPYSTAVAGDFTFATQTLNITGSNSTYQVSIPIIDDNTDEQTAEYLVLSLRNPVACLITGDTLANIYIKDNDRLAPVPTEDIELLYVGSFDPSGSNNSTCEIVAYDEGSQRLFASSAVAGFLDIVDFSVPTTPALISSVDINPYGGITSVAVFDGIVAVASPNADQQLDGSVLFFDINGILQNQVTVGALPDMIIFSPDGTKVLTANEGQPNDAYTIDPEGSVSVIDISGGIAGLTQSDVTTLDFTAFNAQEAALLASGVRKTKSTSTLSQDFEPEYVAISQDSEKAWVTLQENNAIAEIDLQTLTVTDIWALGTKDFNAVGNGFDASDNNDEVLIANWPVRAFFIPDAVANFSVGSTNYLVTANEGDEKEYAGLNERTTVGASGYVLDPTIFPDAAALKKSYNLGRMRVTNLNGDADNDGDYDEIYCVGTRSFTIWNADTQTQVYDSGDDFELFTSTHPEFSEIFNADHEDNELKGRSRSKGPEPEGVAVAEIAGRLFAFISLERIGGVMVYDISNPNDPKLVDYKNNRSVTSYEGDHGPEGILFVPAAASPDAKDYIIVANEISGTLTIFEVKVNITGVADHQASLETFNVFPNPANNIVYFNRMADVEVMDNLGRIVFKGKNQSDLDVSNFNPGIYFVRANDGTTASLVVTK